MRSVPSTVAPSLVLSLSVGNVRGTVGCASVSASSVTSLITSFAASTVSGTLSSTTVTSPSTYEPYWF